ncbi:MAG: hypothetical protein EBV32_06140 [Proteobacteria bacterium]|uniref:Uncharacterized protein n=1 Tax=Candidatus Fonsibacter lacus TaxID=2576439 RepID=A0A964V1Y1_9PROT|nr:hypothetical protein [Candidatus Fonsibacter lacus]NBP60571.1 hypothetical protein [Pseudomonadota bacterium]NCU72682.1 hypothetical protein [Candidatus Fonsibacter lacus]
MKKKTQKEILIESADDVIEMIENDFSYKNIATKFRVDVREVNYFINHSQFSARAREALSNSADRAFDKAEEALLNINVGDDNAVITRQRELAHHYRRKAAVKNRNKFADSHKIQAEVKDTSSTSSWLGEVLSEIDNNK